MVGFRNPFKMTNPKDTREKIAEIPCKNADTYGQAQFIIYGMDSFDPNSQPKNNFIRRYDIILKYPTRDDALAFLDKTNGNPACLQLNGDIKLTQITSNRREADTVLRDLESILKQDGLNIVPKRPIFLAAMRDSEKYSEKFNKPAPAELIKTELRR